MCCIHKWDICEKAHGFLKMNEMGVRETEKDGREEVEKVFIE
jgi:hypothetical protein